jgi:N-methylhydantoinase B/oxoprolinase/acetone carboxylase alpha subunit
MASGLQRIIGGGGYGAPLDRDPRKVSDDVPDGFITVDYARDEYGVVLSEVETGTRVGPEQGGHPEAAHGISGLRKSSCDTTQ